MKKKRIIQATVLVAMAFLMGGCEEEKKYELRFSHYLHVEDMEMDCSDCHGEPGQPSFNAITHDTCLDCHDEPEAEEISVDTCGICHQEKQLALYEAAAILAEDEAPHKDTTVTADEELMELMEGAEAEPTMVTEEEPAEVAQEKPAEGAEEQTVTSGKSVFIHTEALAGKCMDCHDYLMDEELKTVPVLENDDIVAMRNKAHMSGLECATCHIDMDAGVAPASHDLAWVRRHGQFGMQDDASCSVCHTEDTCMDCHSVMQPSSHNNVFRTRSHGFVAATDRNSCMVCHVEDSCTSCHATTRPRSHNARWGASGFRPTHCIGCHDTSTAGDGCVTCHEGGNDVMLHAQYWNDAPINHNQPGIENCYICHWTQTP